MKLNFEPTGASCWPRTAGSMPSLMHDKLVLLCGATPASTKLDSVATLDLAGLEESLGFTGKMKVLFSHSCHCWQLSLQLSAR